MINPTEEKTLEPPRIEGETVSLAERIVVSPATGRFQMAPAKNYTSEGEYVIEGQTVGFVTTGKERIPVGTRFSGWVMGYLVQDGQPVQAAQPILWLRRL